MNELKGLKEFQVFGVLNLSEKWMLSFSGLPMVDGLSIDFIMQPYKITFLAVSQDLSFCSLHPGYIDL